MSLTGDVSSEIFSTTTEQKQAKNPTMLQLEDSRNCTNTQPRGIAGNPSDDAHETVNETSSEDDQMNPLISNDEITINEQRPRRHSTDNKTKPKQSNSITIPKIVPWLQWMLLLYAVVGVTYLLVARAHTESTNNDEFNARPTMTPTDISTSPTNALTSPPTGMPTLPISLESELQCGDQRSGYYNGHPLTFTIQMPYVGSIVFDARASDIEITHIEAFSILNVPLGTDVDGDEIVDLYNVPIGHYKFIVAGDTQSVFLMYDVRIYCISSNPTSYPTIPPTTKPTSVPSLQPTEKPTTPLPTYPAELICGSQQVGEYNGESLTFLVRVSYEGNVIFDASASSFNIAYIEAFTKLNIPLGTDVDSDGILALNNVPVGDYKFLVDGGIQKSAIYHVRVECESDHPTEQQTSLHPIISPTSNPTLHPTTIPTIFPTLSPTIFPTIIPTNHPTPSPTNYPTIHPTQNPTLFPTEYYQTHDHFIGDYKISAQSKSHGNWLLCDGSIINSTTYTMLFDVIGYRFGFVSNNPLLFALPDASDHIIGAIGTKYDIGDRVGSETRTLSNANIPSHFHFLAYSSGTSNTAEDLYSSSRYPYLADQYAIGSTINPSQYRLYATNNLPNSLKSGTSGSGASFNIMQPTIYAGNLFIFSPLSNE
eukprot:160043_1